MHPTFDWENIDILSPLNGTNDFCSVFCVPYNSEYTKNMEKRYHKIASTEVLLFFKCVIMIAKKLFITQQQHTYKVHHKSFEQ